MPLHAFDTMLKTGYMKKHLHEDDFGPLQDISPRLRPRISKRAKRIALRLDTRSHEMHLVIPPRASLKKALDFAYNHQSWIREKLSALPAPVPFDDGAVIPLFDENVTLDIYCDTALKKTTISLKNNTLSIKTNKEDPSGRIARYLKDMACERLGAVSSEKAETIGKTVKQVQVRDTKSRWGSCSPDGTLSFSWRIIFAPAAAFDYLVAHEVAHLVHKNHGPQFWSLCEELCDDYRTGKKWLRDHGHSLMRYGAPERL